MKKKLKINRSRNKLITIFYIILAFHNFRVHIEQLKHINYSWEEKSVNLLAKKKIKENLSFGSTEAKWRYKFQVRI